nr:MAG TPA: hypothetical protein [Caudoviricetes sp.]
MRSKIEANSTNSCPGRKPTASMSLSTSVPAVRMRSG